MRAPLTLRIPIAFLETAALGWLENHDSGAHRFLETSRSFRRLPYKYLRPPCMFRIFTRCRSLCHAVVTRYIHPCHRYLVFTLNYSNNIISNDKELQCISLMS
jgi:hypothetical protein